MLSVKAVHAVKEVRPGRRIETFLSWRNPTSLLIVPPLYRMKHAERFLHLSLKP